MEVVEPGDEALEIATIPELGLSVIALELGAKEIVVGWIPVGKFVEQDGVDWKRAPIRGRRGVGGVGTRRIVI